MPRVIFGVTAEAFHEESPEIGLKGKALEEAVDEDIELFNKFFQSLGNDPLSKFEVSAIKTYLHYKLVGDTDAEEASSSL